MKILISSLLFIGFLVPNINNANLNKDRYTYFFENVKSGISNGNGKGIAFNGQGNVAYSSDGGLYFGTRSNNSYSFTKINTGNVGNFGWGVAFDSEGNLAYVSNEAAQYYRGLFISRSFVGAQPVLFSQYLNDSDGRGVAFDSKGDVGYATNDKGLFVGTKISETAVFRYSIKSIGGITSDAGTGVAFDKDDNIGYASAGGLSIGVKNGSDYSFKNYNTSSSPGITSNNGTNVAFDKDGDVGYVSDGGSLTIGFKDNAGYTFKNYNPNNTQGLKGDKGFGVAFDNEDDVAYSSSNGGLSIGTKSESGYSFTNYDGHNGIITNIGGDVAFDKLTDIVGVAFQASGYLSIGDNFTIDIDRVNVDYEKLSNGLYSINNLVFTSNFPLSTVTGVTQSTQNLQENYYVLITLTSNKNDSIFGYYVTWNGENPASGTKTFDQTQPTDEASRASESFKLNNMIGTNGLEPGTKYTLTVNYVRDSKGSVPTVIRSFDLNTPSSPNPNNGSNSNSINSQNIGIGVGVGVGVGVPALGVGYYLYKKKFSKRKK